MEHFQKLMDKANFQGKGMTLGSNVLTNVKANKTGVRTMLGSLASGNLDEFVTNAQNLGIEKQQATRAIHDTAALAAIVMQVGMVDSW
jgi:uncharacterized protein YidB (DUF937 family)